MPRRRKTVRTEQVDNGWAVATIAYEREPGTGRVTARVVGYKPKRWHPRYWRAVAIAVATMARRRLRR